AKSPEIDAVLTMAPPPRARSSGRARLVARKTPVRARSMVWVHTASSRSPVKASRLLPGGSARLPKALLCRMSSPPKARTVSETMASMPAGVPASAVIAMALPPAALISAATVSALPRSMSATATLAPRAAKPIAVARPIPEPAPDPSATLPSNRMEPSASEVEVAAGHLLEDRAPQDLVGAVGDVDDAERVVGVHQAHLVGETHAAVGLDGAIDRPEAHLHRVGLRHRQLLDRPLAAVEQHRRVEAGEVRRVHLHRGLGQGEGHALVLGDGHAEGDPLARVGDRLLQRPAGEAHRAGRVVDSPERDPEQRDAEPVVERAHHLPRLDADPVEGGLALRAADVPLEQGDAREG